MKEQLISFETAKLAKEKGFPQDLNIGVICRIHNKVNKYHEKTRAIIKEDLNNDWSVFNEVYVTQSLLQKWLREIHKIYIGINTSFFYDFNFNNSKTSINHITNLKYKFYLVNTKTFKIIQLYNYRDFNYFDFYEDCLEKGLYITLNIIKK